MKPLATRFVLFLFVCFCLPLSCATTKMTDTWKDDKYRGTIRKVVVVGIFKEPDTRKIFEDEFADRLRARGVDATASHKIISDAELPDKDVGIGKIRKQGADTILVTRVVDMETVKNYVPGQAYAVPSYYGYYGGVLQLQLQLPTGVHGNGRDRISGDEPVQRRRRETDLVRPLKNEIIRHPV